MTSPLKITSADNTPLAFSICTLVNDHAMYKNMVDSFEKKGFQGDTVEYLFIDNATANQYDAYQGLNLLLHNAKGKYVILCHQDVLLIEDNRGTLEQRLNALEKIDPQWAVAGNAGLTDLNGWVVRITDPHHENAALGNFPARVQSLDENFLVLKKSANLGFSSDLKGFHFYGTDLCLQARFRGYNAYVIDFHLQHLGKGNTNAAFYAARANFVKKYSSLLKNCIIQTTCTTLVISNSPLFRRLGRMSFFKKRWKKFSETA
jgi:hypothetical protein